MPQFDFKEVICCKNILYFNENKAKNQDWKFSLISLQCFYLKIMHLK